MEMKMEMELVRYGLSDLTVLLRKCAVKGCSRESVAGVNKKPLGELRMHA